jgi:hypothetical protein
VCDQLITYIFVLPTLNLNSLCMFIPFILQHSLVCHFHSLNTRHVSAYTAILRCFELFKLTLNLLAVISKIRSIAV